MCSTLIGNEILLQLVLGKAGLVDEEPLLRLAEKVELVQLLGVVD